MYDRRLALVWFALLPVLPACSLTPSQLPTLEGFTVEAAQQVRAQSDDLRELQKLDNATPDQQQQIHQIQKDLARFEQRVLRAAKDLEQRDDWQGADQVLQSATRILPDSDVLLDAQRQLQQRRQQREERVRTELAIHQGEQLLKDAEAYQQLQQLQGPGVMNWLELKNFHRKRVATAEALHQQGKRTLQRQDYALARRALTIAQHLYGEDLARDDRLRTTLEQELAVANRQLQLARPGSTRPTPEKNNTAAITAPIEELQQSLNAGDLLGARQLLDQLQQQSPQHPQLLPLQSQFQSQVNSRVGSAIRQGNEYYSQGKIDQALNVWRDALPLAPDNVDLLGSIARAEKVLENLRVLSTPAAH